VTHPAPSPASDSSWRAHEQEARLLAELLRTARLALLFDATREGSKTSLLTEGLMPLLRRRVGDRPTAAGARESGVVVPFPDQRSRASARGARRRREIVVYFDRWTEPPLAALQVAIHNAAAGAGERAAPSVRLRDALAHLSNRFDANFIILLDRFEEFLLAPADREGRASFVDELVEAVNQSGLPANFLLSLNEEARPRLTVLQQHIPGFDDFSLKLAGGASPFEPPPAVAAPDPLPPAPPQTLRESADVSIDRRAPKIKKPPPPRVQVRTEDVYAFIESTLARTSAGRVGGPAGHHRGMERHAVVERAGRLAAELSHAPTARVAPDEPAASGADVTPPTGTVDPAPAETNLAEKRPRAFAWLRHRLRAKPEPDA
jgi:hypothetical protein